MINPNELRIGNWISLKMSNETWGSLEILSADHLSHLLNEHPEHMLYEINPIPLTLEILEMCGFIKQRGGQWGTIWRKDITLINFEGKLYYKEHQSYPIEYLHQLQNLYFALTQTELKVTLNVATAI